MSRNVILVPAGKSDGIYVASLGLVKALEQNGIKAALFKPMSCCSEKECECNKYSVSFCDAVTMLCKNLKTELFELVVGNFEKFKQDNQADVYVVEGVVCDKFNQDDINANIAFALNCKLLVVNQGGCQKSAKMRALSLKSFGSLATDGILGDILLNKNAPKDLGGHKKLVLAGKGREHEKECSSCACGTGRIADGNKIVADIAYDPANYAVSAATIAKLVDGKIVSGCDCARGMGVRTTECDCANAVLVGNDIKNAANIVILTEGANHEVAGAKSVISTQASSVEVLQALANAKPILDGDCKFKDEIATRVAQAFCSDFVKSLAPCSCSCASEFAPMAPATFRYKLTELAKKANKRIALPEGDEPRTVVAASRVAEAKIARPILFGDKEAILKVAAEQGVSLGDNVEFVDPNAARQKYVDRLVELRKSKGLTPEQALDMLQDNMVLATMMLEANEVDGIVSGAVHTTANTIRPPLQIIKTAPNASLVSSVFFMLMPQEVYIYGDCAINPNPNAQELAQIAIQSADTAKTFGIDPRVAMLSYSTINSGKGPDVDTVVEAVKIVREQRPDINVDGPLQYDASVAADVAAQKAPNSKVAGKANVFIFPSLEAGNIGYKTAQRTANIVAIGPMLQGMRKPVNDLSRGALVDDIVYTIAITAVQATQV